VPAGSSIVVVREAVCRQPDRGHPESKIIGGQQAPLLGRYRPRLVTSPLLNAKQYRTTARRRRLKRSGGFGRCPRTDAYIVHTDFQQYRGVRGPRLHVMIGAHGEKCAKAVFCLDRAELGDQVHSDRRRLVANHVERAVGYDRPREQGGPLSERPTYRDPTGTASPRYETLWAGVSFADQVFGTGDEVEPAVRLPRPLSGQMPSATVVTAAADVACGGGST
jgi:hypothetical protein